MLTQFKLFLISLMMASNDATAVAQVDVNELSCLTHGVFYEAKSEPMEGKIGVANVIVNRSKDPNFKSGSVCGILKEKGQFNYWKNVKTQNLKDDRIRSQVEESAEAAASVLSGQAQDNTNGSTYFVNTKTANKSWLHQMVSRLKRTVKIANHTFFKHRE